MVESRHNLNRVFRALGDPTRRAILERLSRGEGSVTELAGPFRMSFAAVSKHVKVLEEARLLNRRWEGRVSYLSLAAAPLGEADAWLERYRSFWQGRLDDLEAYLRRPKGKTKERSR